MVQARLTGKGQVTIPKTIRDYLNLDTESKINGDRLAQFFIVKKKSDRNT